MDGGSPHLQKYSVLHVIVPDNINTIHFIIPESNLVTQDVLITQDMLITQNVLGLWLSLDIAPGF